MSSTNKFINVLINDSEHYIMPTDILDHLSGYADGMSVKGMLSKKVERFLFNSLRSFLKPGMNVIDCGANIGIFSVMMARRVSPSGNIWAFEPNPAAAEELSLMLTWNEIENCQIVRQAASNSSENNVEFIAISGRNLNQASTLYTGVVANLPEGAEWQTISVPTTTLDKFVAAEDIRPDAIKIDVEGFEREVLAGASRTLREIGPFLAIEVHHPPFIHDIYSLLSSYGYVIWDEKGLLHSRNISERRLIKTGNRIIAQKK